MPSSTEKESRPQLTDDAKEFLRRMRLFQPMLNSDAWRELMAIAEAQKNAQRVVLEQPTKSRLDEREHNYRKGIIFGINLMMTTPSMIIDQAKDIIAKSGGDFE